LGQASGLTLFLPRTNYERTFVVASSDSGLIAVCLDRDSDMAFRTFNCTQNDVWKGLQIPNIRIEVELSSLFDPDERDFPLGSIIRRNTMLGISAKSADNIYAGRSKLVPLIAGLPANGEGMSAGFRKWSVVLGAGNDCRRLFDMDASQ
jgi:hypothetical protein